MAKPIAKTSCKARSQPQKARIPEQPPGSVGAVLCTHKPKVKPSKRSTLPACQGSKGSSLWRGAGQREDETQPLRSPLGHALHQGPGPELEFWLLKTAGDKFLLFTPLPPSAVPCPTQHRTASLPTSSSRGSAPPWCSAHLRPLRPLRSPRLVCEPCGPQWAPSSSSPPILGTTPQGSLGKGIVRCDGGLWFGKHRWHPETPGDALSRDPSSGAPGSAMGGQSLTPGKKSAGPWQGG